MSREENNELKDDIKELSDDVREINENLYKAQETLESVLEDRNIKPSNTNSQHKYILLKNKNNVDEFMFVLSQKKRIDKNMNNWNKEYEIVIDQQNNPNTTDLCTRLKEKINKEIYENKKNEII